MSRLLLDTCTYLWLLSDPEPIPLEVREEILNPENDVFLSRISLWEIIIKSGTNRFKSPKNDLDYLFEQRKRHGIKLLTMDEESLLHLSRLPNIHKDPFDRMLICQALQHGLTILTPDEQITRYPVKFFW